VDDLLNHVQKKIDPVDVENIVVNETEDVLLNYDEAVALVQSECKCDKEQAELIYNQIRREEVERVCGDLINKGIVRIAGYTTMENGDVEPTYELTEEGKKYAETIKNNFSNLS
jgi:hypothetical protein